MEKNRKNPLGWGEMTPKRRPNLLFKFKGGGEIGLGHVYRSIELSKEFAEDACYNIAFFSNINPDIIHKMISKKVEVCLFSDDQDVNGEIEYLLGIIQKKKLDIMIIDQPDPCRKLCEEIKRRSGSVFVAALDYFDFESQVNMIINLFNQNPRGTPSKGTKYFEGTQYAIIREEFRRYHKTHKRIRRNADEMVITFGSADPNLNTLKILSCLNKIREEQFKVNVVLGPLFREKRNVIELTKNSVHSYEILENVEDLGGLMFKADLGFSGGGTTLMEFCAIGTPVMVYPQNSREIRFAEYIEDKKSARVIRPNLTENQIVGMIKNMIANPQERIEMSKAQRRLVDAEGQKRIRNIILSEYISRCK